MWHVWTSVFCSLLAAGAVNSPTLAVMSQAAAPDVALSQEPPQPPKEAGAGTPTAPEAAMGPQEEKIQLPTGPMRIELSMISEERIRYEEEPPENAAQPSTRLHVKLTGERLAEMVGLGHLVIEHMIDDTGAVLASPEDIEPGDEQATSPVRSSRRLLARGFVNRSARAKAASRAARKLTKVSGWVNVIYATETEDLLIDNPLQYLGGYLEHPRLEELDIRIRVIQPGEEVNVRREGRGIALQFEGGRKKIRQIEFFDAWLKPLYPRPRNVRTPGGEEYVYYGSMMGPMDADTQMLITAYPEIEEEKVRFEFKDVELP